MHQEKERRSTSCEDLECKVLADLVAFLAFVFLLSWLRCSYAPTGMMVMIKGMTVEWMSVEECTKADDS